jgi:hypothetical protein
MSSSTTYDFGDGSVCYASDLSPQDLQDLKSHGTPTFRTILAKDGAVNPLRKNTHLGYGTTPLKPREFATDEDVLFSGVDKGGNGICMCQEQDDGTIRVVLPLGTPPDQVAKFHSQARVQERKSKMKAHLKKKVAEKKVAKQKRERTETAEEYAARWKATAELIGKEEAAKLQDAEFWEGPQQVAAMD